MKAAGMKAAGMNRMAATAVALVLVAAALALLAARDAARPAPPIGPGAGPAAAVPDRLGTLPPTPVPALRLPPPPPASSPYDRGIDAAARRGLRVWIEVELPTAWRAGERRWRQTLAYVAAMARRPGVVG